MRRGFVKKLSLKGFFLCLLFSFYANSFCASLNKKKVASGSFSVTDFIRKSSFKPGQEKKDDASDVIHQDKIKPLKPEKIKRSETRAFVDESIINPNFHIYTVAWQPIFENQDLLYRYLAVGGNSGIISLYKYNCKTHEFSPSAAVATFEFSADGGAKVFDLRWEKNGNYLLVAGKHNDSGDCLDVLLFDADNEQLSKCDGEWSGNANDVIFGADWTYAYANHIAVYGYDGSTRNVKVYTFESNSLTEIDSVNISSDLTAGEDATVRWQPNQNIFAVGSYNSSDSGSEGSLSTFEFNGSSIVDFTSTFSFDSSYIRDIAWSSDGSYYVAACSDSLRIYHRDVDGISFEAFSDAKKTCNTVAWTEDDHIVLGNEGTGFVQTYDFDRIQRSLTLLDSITSDTLIYSIDVTPGGKYLGIGYKTDTGINEVQASEWFTDSEIITEITDFDWCPTSTYFAIAGNANSFEVAPYSFSLANTTASVRRNVSHSDNAYVNSVVWTNTGEYLAVGLSPQDSDYPAVAVYTFTERGNISSDPVCGISLGDNAAERKTTGVFAVDWSSPDVLTTITYLAALGSFVDTTTQVNLYQFDIDSLTYAAGVGFNDAEVNTIKFQPDSNYLTVGGLNISGSCDLVTYKLDDSELFQRHAVNISSLDPVKTIDWTSDGSYLAVGSGSNVYVRNSDLSLLNDNAVLDFNDYEEYKSVVNGVKWDASNTRLAAGIDFLEIQRLRNSELVYGGTIYEVAWSADGKLLAVAGAPSSGNEVRVYTYEDGILSFTVGVNLDVDAWSVSWSHSGNYLAVGANSPTTKEVVVYEFSGGILTEIDSKDLDNEAKIVRWHPEKMILLVTGFNVITSTHDWIVYELVSDSLVYKNSDNWFSGSPGVKMAEWSSRRNSSGNYYISASSTDVLYAGVFDEGGDWSYTEKSSIDINVTINDSVWSPEGDYIATALDDGQLKIYSFSDETFTLKTSLDLGTTITSVDWSAEGNYIVTGGNGPATNYDEVTILNYDEGSVDLISTESANYGNFVYAVAWNPDDETLAVSGYGPTDGSNIKLFNFRHPIVEENVGARMEFGETVRTSAWSKDGSLFAIAGVDENLDTVLQLYAFDGSKLTLTYEIDWIPQVVNSMDWSHNGNYLAFTVDQGSAQVAYVYKYDDGVLTYKDAKGWATDYTYNDIVTVHWKEDPLALAVAGFQLYQTPDQYDLMIYDFSNEDFGDAFFSKDYWNAYGGTKQFTWDPSGRYAIIYNAYKFNVRLFTFGSPWDDSTVASVIPVSTSVYIADADWSHDGNYVVVGMENGEVFIYEFTGTALNLKDSFSIGTEVHSVHWNDNYIVVGGNPTGDNKQVQVYEFNTVTETISLLENTQKDFNGIVHKVEWHPSGDYMSVVGTGSPDVQVYNFDGAICSEITDAQITYSHSTQTFFDVSPDGNYIAVAHYKTGEAGLDLIDVSNISNGEAELIFCSGEFLYEPWYVSWSPNGQYVLTVVEQTPASPGEPHIEIYEKVGNQLTKVADYDLETSTPAGIGEVRETEWSPDGRYIAVSTHTENAGLNVQLLTFNGGSISLLDTIDVGDGASVVYSLDWSPNGDYLAIGGSGFASGDEIEIHAFDKTNQVFGAKVDGAAIGSVWSIHWNPDGKYIAVGEYSAPQKTRLFYFNGTTLVLKDTVGYTGDAGGDDTGEVRWDPTGRFLITGEEDDSDPNNCVYPLYEFNRVDETLDLIPNSIIEYDWGINNAFDWTTIRWFPSGDKFAILGRVINELQFFNFSGMPLQQKSEMNLNYGTYANSAKWHSTNNYLAVGGEDPTDGNELKVFKFDSNNKLTILTGCNLSLGSYAVNTIDWSPDGMLLAVGTDEAWQYPLKVYRFNRQSSLCLTTSAAYGYEVKSVAWSPDGNYLAVGGYSPSNGDEVQVFVFDGDIVTLLENASVNYGGGSSTGLSVSWSPDGNYLAVGGSTPSDGNEFKVYSFADETLTLLDNSNLDYGNSIYAIDWSPDGNYLAVGGLLPTDENELKVYSFSNETLTLLANANLNYGTYVYSLAWSPDGHNLVVGGNTPSDDNEIKVYSFTDNTLTLIPEANLNFGTYVYGVDWSFDGKYIAAAGRSPSDTKEIKVYAVDWEHKGLGDLKVCDFDSTAQTLTISGTNSYSGILKSIDWSPGDRYISAAGTANTSFEVVETTTGPLFVDQINTVAWYPESWGSADGVITSSIAYGGNGRSVQMASYDESTTTFTNAKNISLTETARINSLAWTSTGKFLAIGCQSENVDYGALTIFSYDEYGGLSATPVDEVICDYDWDTRTLGQVHDVSWKVNTTPAIDEMYLVAVGDFVNSFTQVAVYQFDGTELTLKDTQDFADKTVNAVSWRPEQNEFAAGGLAIDGTNDVIIYPFDGSDIGAAAHTLDKNATVKSLDWTHDGNYLAVGAGTTLYIVDDSLTDVTSVDCGQTINDVKWDKNYRIVVGVNSGDNNEIQAYYLDGTNLIAVTEASASYSGDVKAVDWSGGSRKQVAGGTENETLHFGSTTYSTSTSISMNTMYAMDINDDGDRFAMGGDAKILTLKSINGKTATSLNNVDIGFARSMNVLSLAWSCTGKYVAVGAQPMSGECEPLYIFSYDSTELELTSVTSTFCGADWQQLDDGSGIIDVCWNSPTYPSRSSSTMYVVAVGDCIHSSTGVIVFEFDSSQLIEKATVDFGNNSVGAVSWKPKTDYIAVGGNNISNTNDVVIYEFTGSSLSSTYVRNLSTSDVVRALDWSPSKTYLAVGSGNNLFVLNNDLTKLDGENDVSVACGAQINSLRWSSDGNYIIVGCNGSAGNEVQVYSFDGAGKTLTNVDSINYGTDDVRYVGWSADSVYKYYAGNTGTSFYAQNIMYGSLTDSDFKKSDWTLNNNEVMEGAAYVRDTLFLGSSANTYFTIYGGGINHLVSVDSRMTLSEDLIISGTLRDEDTTLSFSGDGHTMYFLKDQTLSDLKITASDIVIDAQGHTFNLNGTRVIRSCGATSGSTVHIKNCTCSISSPEALYMEDSTSSFIFEDCVFDLSSNCSIDTGSIEFRGNVVITGDGYSFILGGRGHTITHNSTLTIDSGVSLCLTPVSNAETFLTFSGKSSTLILNNAVLNVDKNMRSDVLSNHLMLKGVCTINTVDYGDSYNPISTSSTGELEFEDAKINIVRDLNLSNLSLRLK